MHRFYTLMFSASISTAVDAFTAHTNSNAKVSTARQLHQALRAKPSNKSKGRTTNNNGGGGASRGFGKQTASHTAVDIINKSYGQTVTEQSHEDAHEAMSVFFSSHTDWHPLFRQIMCDAADSLPLAYSHLSPQQQQESTTDCIWDHAQYPLWQTLPDKPSTNSSLATLSLFLDEWQKSLTDIPMDAFKDVQGGYDTHFLEEGRRTIAVTRFHVVDPSDESEAWEEQLFRLCWSELGYLMKMNSDDTGSLILLPEGLRDSNGAGSLDYVKKFTEEKLLRPIQWLGREDDWEIVAMKRGTIGIRLLYKLGDIPDLSEKYQMQD